MCDVFLSFSLLSVVYSLLSTLCCLLCLCLSIPAASPASSRFFFFSFVHDTIERKRLTTKSLSLLLFFSLDFVRNTRTHHHHHHYHYHSLPKLQTVLKKMDLSDYKPIPIPSLDGSSRVRVREDNDDD